MICLDTNAVIGVLNVPSGSVSVRVGTALSHNEEVALSSVVLFELWYGVENSVKRDLNSKALRELLSGPIGVLDFDTGDAMEAGGLRAHLRNAGTPIGPYDILIAAQARRRDAVLVTANMREFSRVPGLRCEDWST